MTRGEAAVILGVDEDAPADAIGRRYLELRSAFESRLANAPTASLKEVYRNAANEIETACEVLAPGLGARPVPLEQVRDTAPATGGVAAPSGDHAGSGPEERTAAAVGLKRAALVAAALALAGAVAAGIFLLQPREGTTSGRTSSTLLITTDTACVVRVDGAEVGQLAANESMKLAVSPGEHLVTTSGSEADSFSRATVSVRRGEQKVVQLERVAPSPESAGEVSGSGAGATGGTPFRVGGDVLPPQVVEQVNLRYPEVAKAARVQGVVILEAVINTEGQVEEVKVLRGHPLLEQAATDAIRQWRFKPGTLHGNPVPVLFTLTVNFKLK